jgi:hypothetical protein
MDCNKSFPYFFFSSLDLSLGSYREHKSRDHNNLHDTSTANPFHFYTNPKWYESYFDPLIPRNVTALVGKSAYLSCRVKNLGNKTVSILMNNLLNGGWFFLSFYPLN